jgi:hypothetical protein
MLRFQVPCTNVDLEVQPGHREYLSRRKHQPCTSRAKDTPQDSAPCMQRISGAESTHPNIFDHSTMYRCDKSSCDKRYIRSIIGCRAKRRHVTKWPAGDAWDRSGRPSAPNAARERDARRRNSARVPMNRSHQFLFGRVNAAGGFISPHHTRGAEFQYATRASGWSLCCYGRHPSKTICRVGLEKAGRRASEAGFEHSHNESDGFAQHTGLIAL